MSESASDSAPPTEFKAEYKRPSGWALIACVAVLGLLAAAGLASGGLPGQVLGGLFLLAAAYLVYGHFAARRRFLMLTADRLQDDIAIPNGIRWSDIDRLEVLEQVGNRGNAMLLAVHLREPTAVQPRLVLTDYCVPWEVVSEEIRDRLESARRQAPAALDASRPPRPELTAHYSHLTAWVGLAASIVVGGLVTLAGGPWLLVGGAVAVIGSGLALWRLSQRGPQIVIDAAGVHHRQGYPSDLAWDEIEDVVLETRQRGAAREFSYAELSCRGGLKVRLDLNDLDLGPQAIFDAIRRGIAFGRQHRSS